MGVQKTFMIVLPSEVMPAITTTAISTASRPYSSKSCPSSRRSRWLTAASMRSMLPSQKMAGRGFDLAPLNDRSLRRRRERGPDLGEDRVDVRASGGDRDNADER